METLEEHKSLQSALQPVYPSSEKLTQKTLLTEALLNDAANFYGNTPFI